MAYQRKTRDVWGVQGLYYGEWERLTAEKKRETKLLLKRNVTMRTSEDFLAV